MTAETDYRLVLCTCPDQECATRIAERLVEERLAACVSLVPGLTSIYRWQGAIQRDAEVLLLIKTVAVRFEVLAATLSALHPYEVPEIIALPITAGLPDYLTWMIQCTQPDT
ncbi:divalent-cation tolerance protein CutA [Candidatus Thiodictyon syntrophicum]|jgi:periplasmic divalent cation tolerance protein|uniref:Divalent-cation tolerance protein CutA n=1 Tax=Candidatus Thiodictyon syntrophicum TaxID=1166950 RepID=A0A2K8UG54_9GAMM|nr:divalent-cation tolerance protein CutA [Candidatus Thiodictyon syntrophicum]AUB84502.1 divalent-cation tolerance protein CutA [Candidatus Thiodictyon syntrophicum]